MNGQNETWRNGTAVIRHTELTAQRITALVDDLDRRGSCRAASAWQMLTAADRLCSMGMWLTVHMTYARRVYLDGRPLNSDDFKENPEGHTGGALNMVPAYVGYLLANALSGKTRAWLMGQGHSVAAIEAVNCLVQNLDGDQATRYVDDDAGLSRLCQDFYSYSINAEGRAAVPVGSHVGANTAGGISEGGYLGFAELQYVHMPLPGQELVTFLSDGAFEEQRGSDWSPRWWRGEDTGLVMPMMIANGRRIDQRTTMAQSGGVNWFRQHLELNGFAPVDIDGRDPAAFAWAILTMAADLEEQSVTIQRGERDYPVRLPYAIAETVKGYGFPGAGTNAAHNLPLGENPAYDVQARRQFNEGAGKLFIGQEELAESVEHLRTHTKQQRPLEKDHCLTRSAVEEIEFPEVSWSEPPASTSSMEQIDQWFCAFARRNSRYRFRVGNPDEMRSNRMNRTLDFLQHRVVAPEPEISESLTGSVITALNEEAVVSAALANKQGINLAVSYEAFAVKMLGAMRQEIIFARNALETGRNPGWVSVPVIATSHTWENGKNEHSHQDPTLCEAWLGEMSDVAPVLFPPDANSAIACLEKLYQETTRVATVVAAKGKTPVRLSGADARQAARTGLAVLHHDDDARVQFLAIGAYQLQESLRAAAVLQEHHIPCSVVTIIEPGKFRIPRDHRESSYVHAEAQLAALLPPVAKRVFVSHTRAEIMAGVLRRLDTGADTSRFLGYRNRGGTLDTFGMQFANGQSWGHILSAVTEQLPDVLLHDLLDARQVSALQGREDPACLR